MRLPGVGDVRWISIHAGHGSIGGKPRLRFQPFKDTRPPIAGSEKLSLPVSTWPAS